MTNYPSSWQLVPIFRMYIIKVKPIAEICPRWRQDYDSIIFYFIGFFAKLHEREFRWKLDSYAVSQQVSTHMNLDTTVFISIIHTNSNFLKKYLFPDNIRNVSSLGARKKIILDITHALAVEFLGG